MKIHRVMLLIAGIWELLRFCTLFLAVWITFSQMLETNSQGIYWLLVLGNGGLIVAASLLFLYLDPRRFRVLLNVVRLAKILGLFSALLLIILEPIGTGLRLLSIGSLPYRVAPFSLLLIVSVTDLIFLFLLFSFQGEGTPPTAPRREQKEEDPPLPNYRETLIPKS